MTAVLSAVRDRLSTVSVLPSVDLIEDVELILNRGTAAKSGTCFVVPYRERADANQRMSGGFLQRVNVEFLTAVMIRLDDDPRGTERLTQFDGYRTAIREALLGWSPGEDSKPVEFVGAQGGRLSTNTSVYLQTWETSEIWTG